MSGIKTKKILIWLLTFILLASISVVGLSFGKKTTYAWMPFSGGNGIEGDPYILESENDIYDLANLVNSGDTSYIFPGTYYELRNDIDFASDNAFTPIGTSENTFKGNFNGNGYVIKNLHINNISSNNYGLFGYVAENSIIENLGIKSGNISVSNNNAAAGAIAGVNYGKIINCYNEIKIESSNLNLGGLVGENYGTIENCYNTVDIKNDYVYLNATGGIAGLNGGVIKNCFNTGGIFIGASVNAGGIAGRNEENGKIVNCYSTGKLVGYGNIGGIAGDNSGKIANCYSSIKYAEARFGVDSIAGNNNGIVADCFFNEDYLSAIKGTGLSLNEMTGDSVLLSSMASLQGSVDGIERSGSQWVKRSNDASHLYYPELKVFAGENALDPVTDSQTSSRISVMVNRWTNPDAGTINNPLEIYNMDQLIEFRNLVNGDTDFSGKYIKIMADIDLENNDWTPIGKWYWHGNSGYMFNGNLDGNGHLIKNLSVSVEYGGLFGCIGQNGVVRNLGIESGSISSSYAVGSIAARNLGIIENCFNTANISDSYSGSEYKGGGITGINEGTIRNCFNTGIVSNTGSANYVGGIAGTNVGGIIANCYNTGNIMGFSRTGGIVGVNDSGTVRNCYNVSNVVGTAGVGGIAGESNNEIKDCYYSEIFFGDAVGYGDSSYNARLTLNQMTAEGTLEPGGAMANLQNGGAWIKRDADSDYCYYPELWVFYNSSSAAFAEASKNSTKLPLIDSVIMHSWTYGQQPFEPIPIFENGNKREVTFFYEGMDQTSYSESTDKPENAGSYKVIARFANPQNEVIVYFTIYKANPSYTLPSLTAKYGQTLADITLTEGFSWKLGSTTSVGNAGSNQFTLVYTPADTDNYNILDILVTIQVEKINPSFNLPTGLTANYGQTLADIELPEGFAWESAGTSVGNAGSKQFTLVYTPADVNNYNVLTNIFVTLEVKKAIPSYTAPTNLTAKEGQKLSDIELQAGFSWKDGTTSVGSAGSNKFKLIYTPADTTNYETVEFDVMVTVTAQEGTGRSNLPDNGATVGILIGSIAFVTIGIFLMLIFISKKRKANR